MEELSFITIWSASRQGGSQITLHSHQYHELVYYVCGNGKTMIGDKLYSFQCNDIALIPSGVPHSEQHNCNAEVVCLRFSCDTELPAFVCADNGSVVQPILKTMLQELSVQAFGYREMINANLQALYVQLMRLRNPTNSNAKSFSHIISYLADNYHEKIRLTTCAEQLGISYDYFQHRFKQLTGESPQAFLLNHRLQAAKQLLEDPALSCTEITFRCGFSTSAQFSMLFKRAYGVTPQQYRKQIP